MMECRSVGGRPLLFALAFSFSACAPRGATPAPAATPAAAPTAQPMVRTVVRLGETFSPRTGEAAIRAFVPDVAPVETAGECTLLRTRAAGATVATAYYPTRSAAVAQVSLTFDSAGHLIRYSERRGIPRLTGMTRDMSDLQRDSLMRTAEAAVRSTTISFDYAIDQAIASNRGGGKPTNAVLGPVRSMEKLEALGTPAARLERVRKFCGV